MARHCFAEPRLLVSVLLAWGLASLPAPARGQQGQGGPAGPQTDKERTERARRLFSEGVEHADAGEWEQAAARFRSALELKRAPAVEYNLASALVELERYRPADRHLHNVLDSPQTEADIRRLAEELRSRIRDEAARVTVELTTAPAEVDTVLDEEPLPPERLGTPIPVAPGAHVARASRGGRELDRKQLDVPAGESAVVRLETDRRLAPLEGVGEERPADGSQKGSLLRDWRLWAGVGAGVVLISAIAIGVAAGGGGDQSPVEGDFEPGVITWD